MSDQILLMINKIISKLMLNDFNTEKYWIGNLVSTRIFMVHLFKLIKIRNIKKNAEIFKFNIQFVKQKMINILTPTKLIYDKWVIAKNVVKLVSKKNLYFIETIKFSLCHIVNIDSTKYIMNIIINKIY